MSLEVKYNEYDLKPVSYEYKKQDEDGNLLDETDGVYREGLIAEDVNEVRPEMCYKDDDGTLRGVRISDIINEVGLNYSINDWVAFYRTNTGN